MLGEDAAKRAATDAEIAEMRRIVLEAVKAGAIGFATSTLEQHNGEGGIPMPSRLADEKEMLALTGALGEAGRGVFMLTKGMTSTIPWLEKIAGANGRPVMIAAMFVDPGDPTRVFKELGEIEQARGRGRELWAQVGCFPLGMEFTLHHPYPLEALMAWRPAMIGAQPDALSAQILADPSFRSALIHEMGQPGVPNRISNENWDYLTVMEVKKPSLRPLEGKTSASSRGSRSASRGTSSSTWGSRTTSTPCSTAGSSTRTRRRSRSSCAIPARPSRCPMRARISPSSATRALVSTSSATGCASAAT